MSTAPARAVSCTRCGAPLDLHGGHRVRSLTCGHCGSVLDARDEYKVVKQFQEVERPPMPLALGMQGRIKDVDFTIIGVVQYRDGEGYQWLEYQLFSPTHGYHWLNFTDGHFVFSRRVRDMPRMSGKQRATFKVKDRTFKVYESYHARVVFVEGELTYVAEVGDVVQVAEGISPPFVFSRERTKDEEEYQLGEYLPFDEVYRAFGATPPRRGPSGIHGAQPYTPAPWALSLSRMGRWFAIPAGLVAVGLLLFGGGTERLRTTLQAAQVAKGVQTPDFAVEGSNRLMSLELHSRLDNAWAWYDVSIQKGDEQVARLGKQISYYHGVSGGDSWSEGSRSAKAYFKLEEPGTYHLALKATGGVGNSQGPLQDKPVQVVLNEGVLISRYFFILTGIALLAALWEPLRRMRFEGRRWEAVEEDDDE